jgi:hypothetical protein
VYIFVYSKENGSKSCHDVDDNTYAHLFDMQRAIFCMIQIRSRSSSFGILTFESHPEPPQETCLSRPSCLPPNVVCIMRLPKHEGSPKNMSLPFLVSPMIGQDFRAEPCSQKHVSFPSLLSMTTWADYFDKKSARASFQKRVSPISPVHDDLGRLLRPKSARASFQKRVSPVTPVHDDLGRLLRQKSARAPSKNVSLLSLLSATDWQRFPARAGPCSQETRLSCLSCPPLIGKDFLHEPALLPINASLLSLLSANDWQRFSNLAGPCSNKRVSPVSPVGQ